MPTIHLTKHHGLGNDFLVVLDPDGSEPLTAHLVVGMCDRHRGIGADGVLRVTSGPGEPDAVMELYNADGSRAEMSGNGIRCLAQAMLRDGWATAPDVAIATDAGLRVVTLHEHVDSVTDILSVDMGAVRFGRDAPEWTGGLLRRARWADMGNPHLVVEVDQPDALATVDLVTMGEKVNAAVPDGANVHLVAADGASALTIRTYERGVGLTQACGTGACASAAVAQQWGITTEIVTVRMPGGSAEVHLAAPGTDGTEGTIRLVGPATFVAAAEFLVPDQG